MNIIYKGAEATLYKDKYLGINTVNKERKPKNYRIEQIDNIIRKQRTKKETKMTKKARKAVNTPYILKVNPTSYTITMEEIKGQTLKKRIKKNKEDPEKIGKELGKKIMALHNLNIVHNDLTTSNIIRYKNKLYFIDFGLAEKTEKTEDKAMDLLVFKRMLKSTHWEEIKQIWDNLKETYKEKEVLKQLKEIEGRARYT